MRLETGKIKKNMKKYNGYISLEIIEREGDYFPEVGQKW